MNLKIALKRNFVALFDLAEKCKNESYRFVANPLGDSKDFLKKLGLIDVSGKVPEDVKRSF